MYGRPSHIRWFLSLQVLAAFLGAVVVVAARSDVELEAGLARLVSLLLAYVAVRGCFIWMAWRGKNWARFALLAWFLYTYIQYVVDLRSGATLIQLDASLKTLIAAVAVLQASSLALLFTRSANQWFRPSRAGHDLLFPR